jgi:hypothetical protein
VVNLSGEGEDIRFPVIPDPSVGPAKAFLPAAPPAARGVGVEVRLGFAGSLISGDLNGFLSVLFATSTRRRLALGSGVFDDMAGRPFEMHLIVWDLWIAT